MSQAGPGDISFLVNRKYEKQLESTKASAVIVGQEMPGAGVALLVAEDPYFAFTQTLVLLYGHRKHKEVGDQPPGLDCRQCQDRVRIATSTISRPCPRTPGSATGASSIRASISGRACSSATAASSTPTSTIYDGCRIGSRVIIHANSTIGVDGFGYATHEGVHHKIPQVGGVIVEDDVEIGSSCSIQRGTLDDTVIGQGSKLGDLVTIGHGTRIGPHCLLVAQVGIAGSTTIGHHCTIGGQVGVVGHITIGNNVTIGAQAGVINSIPDGETVLGAPAIDAGQARRAYTMLPYLPQMRQDIRALQNQLEKIWRAQP